MLLDFEVKGEKVNRSLQTSYGQISTLRGIFSAISGTQGHETHYSYSLPGSHNTDDIFKVMSSEVKVTDNILNARFFLLFSRFECYITTSYVFNQSFAVCFVGAPIGPKTC